MPLNLTKVAYGAQSLDEIRAWFAGRGPAPFVTTRNMPKRAGEIVTADGDNGSLFWIFRHQLVARSPILSFGEAEGGRVAIHVAPDVVLVRPQARRAHQGWRYLEAADAPGDLADGDSAETMPADLARELARLGLA